MKQLFKFLLCLAGIAMYFSVSQPTKAASSSISHFETTVFEQVTPAMDFSVCETESAHSTIVFNVIYFGDPGICFTTIEPSQKTEPYSDLRIVNCISDLALFSDYNHFRRTNKQLEIPFNTLPSKHRLCDNGPWVNGMFLSRIS
jgi:hypothetical protein